MEEVRTGLHSIDFYIPEYNLCIEIDGTVHYYGRTHYELAKTSMKYRLMEKA